MNNLKFVSYKLVFRLKLVQITSMISNDGFVSKMNVPIATDDFVDRLSDFVSFWQYDRSKVYGTYPRYIQANWSSYYEVNLTRVLHPKGFCYTFNFPGISQFFHVEK